MYLQYYIDSCIHTCTCAHTRTHTRAYNSINALNSKYCTSPINMEPIIKHGASPPPRMIIKQVNQATSQADRYNGAVKPLM